MNLKKDHIYIFLISSILILLFIGCNSDYAIKHNISICEKVKQSEFKGVVLRSYEDYDNKGFFTAEIRTTDGVIKYTSWHTIKPIWSFLNDNDSILKIKNSFDYKIYKNCDPDKLVFVKGYSSCDSIYRR